MTEASREESCGDCYHWVAGDDLRSKGVCRRYPPGTNTIVLMQVHPLTRQPQQGTQLTQHIPTTNSEEFCGEFKRGARIALSS